MNIIACGPTGAKWNGEGGSIGVNDCEKFGNRVGSLVVVNSSFELPRLQIIKNTLAPAGFYSQLTYWADHPSFKMLPPMRQFNNRHLFEPYKYVYTSRTSPLIAISLAVYLGHQEIVLYGVDFHEHPIVKDDVLSREVDIYKKFIDRLDLIGIKVYLSTEFGALKGFLPLRP